MLQQAMAAPTGLIDAGQFKVARSPLEGVGNIAKLVMAQRGLNEVDKKFAELGSRQAQMTADEVRRYQQMKAGTPEVPATPAVTDVAQTNQSMDTFDPQAAVAGQAAVPGNARGAIEMAMLSRNPMLQKLGGIDYAAMLKREEPVTLPEGAQRIGPDGKIIVENKKDFRPPVAPDFKIGELRKMKMGRNEVTQEYQGGGVWKEISKGELDKPASTTVINPPAITAVTLQDPNNPNATIVVDGRSGRVLGAGPKLTETGKSNFKQATTMQGIGSDLQKAEDLLLGQVRDSEGNVTKGSLPTGSGIGSVVDSAAGLFGMSPSGAKEADALKVVAGKLIQKVPRFEGPQSDKDVALYKQMAADAGNERIPRERRVAAVQKMREIYSGYEDGARGRLVQDQITPSRPQAPAGGASGGWSVVK